MQKESWVAIQSLVNWISRYTPVNSPASLPLKLKEKI